VNRNTALELVAQLRQQTTAIELFIEEGDQGSVIEARELMKGLDINIHSLRNELQISREPGMSVDDVRDELYQYSGGTQVEIAVAFDNNLTGYYLVRGISELAGTSPTIPVISLGECVSTSG
jgi:hypothetical protein